MEVFLARQPLLNRREKTVGYELFFRDGPSNYFPKVCPHEAASKLIGRTMFAKGIRPVTSEKRALISFSEESILKELPFLINPEDVIVEIKGDVSPSDDVYAVCKKLVAAKYKLAIDGTNYNPEWYRFIRMASIVKFDINKTPVKRLSPLISRLRDWGKAKILAVKIETRKDFDIAKKAGFQLFQGYYFCKPELHKQLEPESNELIMMELFKESVASPLNHQNIAELFEKDSNLTYKLFCFINSGGFPLKAKINSVKQALTYIGDKQIRLILSLFATTILASGEPLELTKMCVVRAKFCELVVRKVHPAWAERAFLTGMFSLLDSVLGVTMNDVVDRLPLHETMQDTLLDESNKCQNSLSMALRSVKYIEQGKWYLTEREASKMGISDKVLYNHYREAIEWSEFYEKDDKTKKVA